MKFSSVAIPRAAHSLCSWAGLGLVVLAAMPVSSALAGEKDAQPTAAPANPAPAAKPTPAPAAPAKPAPASKPASLPLPVECVRTGQRVAAALARDDSGTASQFHNFYVAFKCPPQRLAQAFGCLVNLQAANPTLTNPSPEQVTQCWDDPVPVPKTTPPPAPTKPSPAAEGGEKK